MKKMFLTLSCLMVSLGVFANTTSSTEKPKDVLVKVERPSDSSKPDKADKTNKSAVTCYAATCIVVCGPDGASDAAIVAYLEQLQAYCDAREKAEK